MVPAAFVLLDHLPLTPNGKIDRKALSAKRRGEAPAGHDKQASWQADELQKPRTPTEEMLVAIWAEVLGFSQVGIRDNFFELGGHSLLATQVISRMTNRFECTLPIQALFENPTIVQLAEQIEDYQGVKKVDRAPIEALPRHSVPFGYDELPLSYAQQRLWFLEQLEGPSPTYNIPSAYRLTGTLHVTALEQAINEIIRRHEVLRTTFPTVNGLPVQRIAALPPASYPSGMGSLTVVELQHLTDEVKQRAELEQRLAEEAKRLFNLAEGPLWRVILYQLGDTEQLLLLNMHHIITDGWSLGIWWQELDTLYRAFAASPIQRTQAGAGQMGMTSPLPELSLQYADFSQWQRSWLTGEVLEKQLAYWQKQLADAPTLLELLTDHPRPPVQTFNGRFIHFEIPSHLAGQLRDFSLTAEVTLFMTLEAAFAVLLSRYSRQEDIVIGTSIANRHYLLIEPLIGFFVNTLPLRTDLSGNPTFEQLLKQVRQVLLSAYAHQDIPFEHLVSELVDERNLSHPPLMFFRKANQSQDYTKC
jgi:acyl carrier protein